MPKLIVNADDFGYTPKVTEAIIHGHLHGIITSSTVMINLPTAATGLALAQEKAPDLALGLHINLTHGQPISPLAHVKSLVDDNGHFYSIERLPEVSAQFDGDELYEEIAAQIERFMSLTGKLPTHLDSHYHITFLHPLALEAMLTLAAEHTLPMRGTSVEALENTTNIVEQVQLFMPYMPEAFIIELVEQLKTISNNAPQGYFPVYFENRFHDPHNALGDLLNILTDVPTNPLPVEIMCHPGYKDDPGVSNGRARQLELETLCHPATREVVEKMGITLTNFAEFTPS